MSDCGELYLWAMLGKATAHDRKEGLAAYCRYHQIMRELSRRFSVPLDRAVAAFVSLSPNSDYIGNLRSTVSVLAGIYHGVSIDRVQVSTYRHCLERAWSYANGEARFLDKTKGPKITAFYHNVLDPKDRRFVTIDGHMVAIWRNQELTMREAIPKAREYRTISDAVKRIADHHLLVPCEVQAIMWHARKRQFNIKHSDQLNMWPTDDPNMLEPYPLRRVDGPVRPERTIQPAAPRVSHLW